MPYVRRPGTIMLDEVSAGPDWESDAQRRKLDSDALNTQHVHHWDVANQQPVQITAPVERVKEEKEEVRKASSQVGVNFRYQQMEMAAMVVVRGFWPRPLAMAIGYGICPWPLAMSFGHGLWPWPLGMTVGHGNWPWPSEMVFDHGPWTWPLAMALGLLAMAFGRGLCPWPL